MLCVPIAGLNSHALIELTTSMDVIQLSTNRPLLAGRGERSSNEIAVLMLQASRTLRSCQVQLRAKNEVGNDAKVERKDLKLR
jgi:hypothetical protein